jgi:hypothetical protein
MSSGGEPEFGSGAYYGGGGGPSGAPGGMGGFPGLGGGFPIPGMGNMNMRHMGPGGPFGAWPSCGCSGCLIVLAGILLVFGGCLKMLGQ